MGEELDKTPQKSPAQQPGQPSMRKSGRHFIKPTWLRRLLKGLGIALIVILLLPVLVYVPPVQTFLKDTAARIVKKSTGLEISIESFRLGFPLDVSLRGVSVVEASGDTMVSAREAIADVRLLPLLALDIKINKLKLLEGYYRMVSPDSSMVMKIRAGLLEVDNRSSFNIGDSRLILNKGKLDDADVSLYMNVWKQKKDTASSSTPFYIAIEELQAKNLRFAMSMLPTIDTLVFRTADLRLHRGVIDLGQSKIALGSIVADDGDATYLIPTPEFIAAHPLPTDNSEPSDSVSSPPFVIEGKTIALKNFNALYATKGVTPAPGFDPSYIQATGIDIHIDNFYNEATTIRLPITSMKARERSGLEIVAGNGTIALENETMNLDSLRVMTKNSDLRLSMIMPLDVMTCGERPMDLKLRGYAGLPDVAAFMPSLSPYTSVIPSGTPVNLDVDASGTMSSIIVDHLDVNLPSVLSVSLDGWVKNPAEFKKMQGDLRIDGKLMNPKVADKLAGGTGYSIPTLDITGHAKIFNQAFDVTADLITSAGDVAADGRLNLNSEHYFLDADISGFDVAGFLPDLGIGHVTASIFAEGAGFDPSKAGAHTDARIDIESIEYNGHNLTNISMAAALGNGVFDIDINSGNAILDLGIKANGTVAPDDYIFDIDGDIRNVDLYALGLTESTNGGLAKFVIKGSAKPQRWLYDVGMDIRDIYWELPEGMIVDLPEGMHADFSALENSVDCRLTCKLTELAFTSPRGLKDVVDRFSNVSTTLANQIEKRYIDFDSIHNALPPFKLDLNASGRGMLRDLTASSGISMDTLFISMDNADIITGELGIHDISNGSLTADTILLSLRQRGALLDYKAHMGNRPGTLDEFNKINLNGYLGTNRFAASLSQQNLQGDTGYRLGLTGAVQDSVISVHFTPLKSTIAYMPWTFNADNHIDLGPGRRISANLLASSAESSVLLETVDNTDGDIALHAKLDNLKIEDFVRMSLFGPPIAGTVNSDIKLQYHGDIITGTGTLGIKQFTYEKTRLGNLDLNFGANLDFVGDTKANASLLIDGHEAITAYGTLHQSDSVITPMDLGVSLNRFPLKLANAFLDRKTAQLAGSLNGNMTMSGTLAKPLLNGHISCDSASVLIPMIGSSLRLGNEPLTVTDNVVSMDGLNIWGQNDNPLTISGKVDARSFSNVLLNVGIHGNNFQLVNNDRRAKSDLYGKAFMNLDATASGSLSRMNVNATLRLLNTTDVAYTLPMTASALGNVTNAEDVVKFVQFSDTTQVEKADSLSSSLMMRINAALTIDNGARVAVNLSGNGTDKVSLTPSGTLNYYQNYMGDMTLNGQLNLGTGYAQYNIPVIGRSVKFNFEPGSHVLFNGDIMNPSLNILGNDEMKVSVTQSGGSSNLVTFDVGLSVTNTLSSPKVMFDLSTKDDVTIENQLQSMTPEQRSSQAINLLLYGQYLAQGYSSSGFNGESMLYGFLTSQLNSWAANNIRGVDLSFGVDQYETGTAGNTSTATSYSYQVSKSLFNNKFKIIVGGNYSTDASADENFAQNLVNDIAFEYMLKQTNNLNIYLQLFRHTGFESILEGEITEMGVGFVMKRRLSNLHQLFRFGRRRRNVSTADQANSAAVTDSLPGTVFVNPNDSIADEK